MTWTLCASGSAMAKAGFHHSKVDPVISGSLMDTWSDEAESIISSISRVDVVDKYNDLENNGKRILDNLCSNMIAQKISVFMKNEYGSLREWETVLDIIENDIRRGLTLIEEDKLKTYLGIT